MYFKHGVRGPLLDPVKQCYTTSSAVFWIIFLSLIPQMTALVPLLSTLKRLFSKLCQMRKCLCQRCFFGINLYTVEMKASLPDEKLQRICKISQLFTSANILKQQLLSLMGHLNFAMCASPQDCSFNSRLFQACIY